MSRGACSRGGLTILLSAAMLSAVFAPALAASRNGQRFAIAAQPLDQALADFSVSTGLQMLYDSSLAAGRLSSPVAGEMQPREALALMLAGTGLTARFETFDPATNVVSYVGPAGPRTHVVADPDIQNELGRLKRGDMVELSFAEAFLLQKV